MSEVVDVAATRQALAWYDEQGERLMDWQPVVESARRLVELVEGPLRVIGQGEIGEYRWVHDRPEETQ